MADKKPKPASWVELHREGRFFVLYADHRKTDKYVVMADPDPTERTYSGHCWPCSTLAKAKAGVYRKYVEDLASMIKFLAESLDWEEPATQARFEAAIAALEADRA